MPLWLWLVGCTPVACDALPGGADRDQCLHAALASAAGRPAATVAEVIRLGPLFSDPLMRDASILAWVRDNRGAAVGNRAAEVCGLLRPPEQSACARQIQAVHLNR